MIRVRDICVSQHRQYGPIESRIVIQRFTRLLDLFVGAASAALHKRRALRLDRTCGVHVVRVLE
jgi:hypothetical protein